MTFREYFFKTIVTTKSFLKITSSVLTICFILLFLVLKIGGKLGEEETFVQVYNSIGYFAFVYGLTLFAFVSALINYYNKAKSTVKLFSSISPDIKEKFCLQLYEKQQNIKYSYLDFEILGLYEDNNLVIDRLQNNIRIILCAILKIDSNFHKHKLSFDEKHKVKNIELNGFGLLKKINIREWNKISASVIESYLRELIMIAHMEGYFIIHSTHVVNIDE